MGRSKPRTNKRPPPIPSRQPAPAQLAAQHVHPHPHAHADQQLPTPPPSNGTIESDFSSALHTWSNSALGRLDALPKLTQSQLSAIAGAAAGVNGEIPPNLPIDLPASLAALFEAKLTLDREKAKLMRMQKELKGYREGVAAISVAGQAVPAQVSGHGHGHGHGGHVHPPVGNGKGKEVMEECTCGRQHSPVYEEYSDEEECGDCDCDCHYVECDHEPGTCDCEEIVEDEHDHHDHHGHGHGHGHHHHDHDHEHDHDGHDGGHDHGDEYDYVYEDEADLDGHTCEPVTIPNPYLQKDPTEMTYQQALEAYRENRDNAARGLDEIGGMFKAAGWEPEQRSQRPLSEDPERLDEAVRELFNWIKAVVWTIEQAAIVAGRRRT